jgi:trimeric autotransporter adhesin
MAKRVPAGLIALLLLVAYADNVAAQGFAGGLRGVVRDANGVVPGAEVTLTNEGTAAARTVTTNAEGTYAFENVLPATYTLKVSLTGFKSLERAGIRIGTQQILQLDLTLEVGQLQETITVTGAAPLIDTSNASVASTLDKATLETLPTAGRNPFFLAVTVPNVIPSGDPQFVRQQDQTNSALLSLAGGPRRGNNYTLEGVSITDLRNRAVIIPNIESVEEVKVQVSTFDAEMGRTGGGVFNTVGKSGSNSWHGSGLYQNRPSATLGKFYFADKAGLENPENYFHLAGGSFGGPIMRNRTFFWASSEGYQTFTGRNSVLTLPTERERNGDFSQSGVTIYDPLTYDPVTGTRQPFAGNVIPQSRISQIARNGLTYVPLPTAGKALPAVAGLLDKAIQITAKVDHRWSDKLTSTGMYGWYDSEEPESRFYGGALGENPGDPSDGALFRTVHVLALNNIWVPTNSSVWSFRYGYNSFVDDCVPAEFDPSTLGFAQGYLSTLSQNNLLPKFPDFDVAGYGRDDAFLGDRTFVPITWYSHNANVSFSKFVGRQTFKMGVDFRRMGVDFTDAGDTAGDFQFTRGFTSGPNPTTAQPGTGDAFASFLLGLPATGNIQVATKAEMFINYVGAYFQDDFRVSDKLTMNFGLRYEHEGGMRERNNNIVVGWAADQPFPVQVPGLNLTGGLMYAGVDGANEYQGDPKAHKLAPRVGFAYAMNPATVVRGGYGLFWAPLQGHFPGESAYGTRGFTAVTSYVASFDNGLTPCPGCGILNPFPNGLEQPLGSAGGRLTGVGGSVNFIDGNAKSPYVQQYSVDLQREIPGNIAISAGFVGSRSENLTWSGTVNGAININQIPVEFQSLGAALNTVVTNPFLGTTLARGALAGPTVTRGQLLRPFPQFTDVNMRRSSGARSVYNSAVFRFERRINQGWGARLNYTFSRTKDSQVQETSFFGRSAGTRYLNAYDLDSEYALSINDQPHRFNLALTYELPFGEGKPALNSGVASVILGGWSVTAVGSYASGYPISINQNTNNSGLLGSGQRPNVVEGVDPFLENPEYDSTCSCLRWLNPAAWSSAAAFTFGNAPRTDDRVRTPFKKSMDIAFQKVQRLGGGKNVMVRLEMINAFNNPNFVGPFVNFGLGNFGQVTEVGGFPRLLQVMVRFGF